MNGYTEVEIIDHQTALSLTCGNGARHRFHAIWLRDNATDPTTRSDVNGQKLITLQDIPESLQISKADLDNDGNLAICFKPEDKTLTYPGKWLIDNAYDTDANNVENIFYVNPELELWDNNFAKDVTECDYHTAISSKSALHHWLQGIQRHGIAVMRGAPIHSGALLEVAALFGFVRETNYGKWFEVRTEVNPANLAFTSLGLQPHTDNPYRDPVPTMQLLYCLENSASGGDSIVVDGFNAVRKLYEESPQEFELLAKYRANFEYLGGGDVYLRAKKSIIELAPDGEVVAIRFNNRSCATITDVPYDDMAAYYEAYRHLAEIIERPGMSIQFKLAPGECFIVDNTRILHGRNGFQAGGNRWLQGCYPDKDGVLSRLNVLAASL